LAEKPTFYGAVSSSIYKKTLVVYEASDDYGSGGTFDSREFGSTGPRIACCLIKPYKNDREDTIRNEELDSGGRLLAEESDEDMFEFSPGDFRQLLGEESAKMFENEMSFYDQD